MQLDDGRQSDNIEDRRGMGGGGFRMGRGFGMPGGGIGFGRGGMGLGGLLVLLAIGYFLTGDPLGLMGGSDVSGPSVSAPAGRTGAPGDAAGVFVSKVLADTEDTWDQIFASQKRRYERPVLVLFNDAVDSACGMAESAVGPFYCPGDHKLYIDLSFFGELDSRFGAPGDFAQAYVIAHEVGHHVQNLLGLFDQGRPGSRAAANQQSIRQELQADCFAGVWGHYAQQRGILDPTDLNEGLNAAAAVGDDRIQSQGRGRVTPETWTHGSSQQRTDWFKRGFDSGQMSACDTSR